MAPPRVDSNTPANVHSRIDDIRASAGALFLDKGYASTTMNDIARSVGILPGSLYHHFTSKEAVAVEILDAFNDELNELAAKLRKSEYMNNPPGERLRHLCECVVGVSLRNSAAVRLRAFEPPTVASDRFRNAVALQPTSLQRLWNSAANDLRDSHPGSRLNPRLLVRTMQRVTTTAATSLPAPIDPKSTAQIICTALLKGVTPASPDDKTLEESLPLAVARKAVSKWVALDGRDETTAHILNSARQEFARRGFDATTIRDIVDASGIRMASIYRRIPSMQSMFVEIAQNYTIQFDQTVQSVLRAEPTATAETLDALAYVIVHAKRTFKDETRMMSLGWNLAPVGQLQFMDDYRRQVDGRMKKLTHILAEGRKLGTVTTIGPPKTLAPLIRNILWVHLTDYGRTSARQEHSFLRSHLLRGGMTTQ